MVPDKLDEFTETFNSLSGRKDRFLGMKGRCTPIFARVGFIDPEQFARLRAADRCHHSDCDDWSVFSPDHGCRS